MTVMHVYYQRRAMKISRDLTVLGTTQTQGENLLCAAKHVQYETRRSGWKQCISEQRGSVSQGAWQWSQHTHNLPLVTFFTEIIVN